VFTEKRQAPRSRRLKTGTIVFNNFNSVLTCQLRDCSATGLRLALETVHGTPDEFVVTIPGVVEKAWARKVWYSNREVGVELL
jgi:hypothetical protein